jgi:hypothetical protein
MLGGMLITSLRRILGLALVACGIDIEATWLDEALGILLGGYVLHHFGNDLVAIGLFALTDLGPGLVMAGLERLRGRHDSGPEPEPPSAPAAQVPRYPVNVSGRGW